MTKNVGKFHTRLCYFFADHYQVTQGICRNKNNQSDDIFSDYDVTLAECNSKCDNMDGCNAVSYQQGLHYCRGTSMKSTTSSESGWRCYFKIGI